MQLALVFTHKELFTVTNKSDANADPFQVEWATTLRQSCAEQNTPYFFKQTGTWLAKEWALKSYKGDDPNEWPMELRVQQFPRQYLP